MTHITDLYSEDIERMVDRVIVGYPIAGEIEPLSSDDYLTAYFSSRLQRNSMYLCAPRKISFTGA